MSKLLPATMTFIIFNIFLLVMVRSYSLDPKMIDEMSAQGVIDVNESLTEGEMSYYSVSWIDSFRISFNSVPWWISIFLVLFESVLIVVIIYAWIRGVA